MVFLHDATCIPPHLKLLVSRRQRREDASVVKTKALTETTTTAVILTD